MPADLSHLPYALADPLFYEDPARMPRRGALYVPATDRDWQTWEEHDNGHWIFRHRDGTVLPEQGWKLHVASTPIHAQEVLSAVSRYCFDGGVAFKHLPGAVALQAQNAKDAERSGAGKFITIYPPQDRLRGVLDDLDALVGGRPGPYILSDLRWNDGPIHLRYGGFVPMWRIDEGGQRRAAIHAPGGELVDDVRGTRFAPPTWVQLPDYVRQQLDALGPRDAPDDFGYAIDGALHYSNAGGVYTAHDRQGQRVVLKEGRPHAGLTPDGRDAVARLADEFRTLTALASGQVVAAHRMFDIEGHRFLVLDHLEGTSLSKQVVMRAPAIRADSTRDDYGAYRDWALRIAVHVRDAVTAIHRAGYVHGDLHPGNVHVTPDDRVVLMDFEMARPVGDETAPVIGAPGFVPRDGRRGIDADLYALACIELFLFVPLTSLLGLDPVKADDLIIAAQRTYALDDRWAARLRESLTSADQSVTPAGTSDPVCEWGTDPLPTAQLQELIGRSLEASADYSRADRIWPGDPVQFSENSISLAHGIAGVIHALHVSGFDIPAAARERLADGTARMLQTDGISAGLCDGLSGAAWLHRRLGDHDRADRMLTKVMTASPDAMDTSLYRGLAGVGLFLLSEAAHDERAERAAIRIAQTLRTRLDTDATSAALISPQVVRTDQGGLMRGPTGTALFAIRLYERTGDPQHVRLAQDAIDRDLACCRTAADGSLQIDEGWRLVPYLASGSAGVGVVLAQLLPHLADTDRYLQPLEGIRAAASAPFTIESGLFEGRAGLIHALTVMHRLGYGTDSSQTALRAHIDALRLHAIRHGSGIAFPGRGILRLSCDLATGSAGVLAALQAYRAADDSIWTDAFPLLVPLPEPVSSRTERR